MKGVCQRVLLCDSALQTADLTARRSPNDALRYVSPISDFVIRASSLIRHSAFVIRSGFSQPPAGEADGGQAVGTERLGDSLLVVLDERLGDENSFRVVERAKLAFDDFLDDVVGLAALFGFVGLPGLLLGDDGRV